MRIATKIGSGIRGTINIEVDPLRGEVQVRYIKEEVISSSSLWALKDVMGVFLPEINAMQLASYLGSICKPYPVSLKLGDVVSPRLLSPGNLVQQDRLRG